MWVFEEMVDGRKLTDIINTEHMNVKYLPGIALPTNVVAIPDLAAAVRDATILVFVLPHQVRMRACLVAAGGCASHPQRRSSCRACCRPLRRTCTPMPRGFR